MRVNAPCTLLAAVVLTGAATMTLAAPDYWDSRLNDLGVCYIEASPSPGTWYWRLVSGVYEDENQSGGTHHIYYKCLNASSNPIENQRCWAGWPSGSPTAPCPTRPNPPDAEVEIYTKGSGIDDYWGNFGMAGGWCPFWPEGPHGPYGAWVDGVSDEVWGMGMPCNRHVSYRLTWQYTPAQDPGPMIGRSPSSFAHTIDEGDSLASDTFSVWNAGASTLSYTITDNAGWLYPSPASGSSTGETDSINIVYSTTGLAVGTHAATITISDPNASNNPQTIAVSVTIEEIMIPGDFDGDGDVDQGDFGSFQGCLSGAGIAQEDPACDKARLDGDVDVDQEDFALFAGCMSGPNILGDPDCLNP